MVYKLENQYITNVIDKLAQMIETHVKVDQGNWL